MGGEVARWLVRWWGGEVHGWRGRVVRGGAGWAVWCRSLVGVCLGVRGACFCDPLLATLLAMAATGAAAACTTALCCAIAQGAPRVAPWRIAPVRGAVKALVGAAGLVSTAGVATELFSPKVPAIPVCAALGALVSQLAPPCASARGCCDGGTARVVNVSVGVSAAG